MNTVPDIKPSLQGAPVGIGSIGWLGAFFLFTALGTLAMAVASVGNSLAIRRVRDEVAALRTEV